MDMPRRDLWEEIDVNEEELAARERAILDKELELAERTLRGRVLSEATKRGLHADDCYVLCDLAAIDESPESLSRELKRLADAKPWLRRAAQKPPPSPGVGGPPIKVKKNPDQLFGEMLRDGVRRAKGEI